MPGIKMNFSEIPEGGTIRQGRYLAQVLEVDDSKTTRNGDEMWVLHFKLIEGPEGDRNKYPSQVLERFEFSDNIVWSDNINALKRAKLACKAMGIDVDRDEEVEVLPEMFKGRAVYLDIQIEKSEYQGTLRERNSVQFAGYHAVPEEIGKAIEDAGTGDDVPF